MKGALVICPASPGRFDGVGDYSFWLARYLQSHLPTFLVTTQKGGQKVSDGPRVPHLVLSQTASPEGGWNQLWRSRHVSPFLESDVVLLQYVPQMYVPTRDVGWLLLWLSYARLRQGKKVIVTAHEYDIPWSLSMSRILARVMLNLLMGALGTLAEKVVVTYGHSQRKLSRLLFRRKKISIIPVGSNIPLSVVSEKGEATTDQEQRTLGNGQRTERHPRPTILTIFGQPAGMDRRLLSSLGVWVLENRLPVRIQWIGRPREDILDLWLSQCGLPLEFLEVYEGQPTEIVSWLLQASDLFLAPLVDGVSTRRTTVIAALGHGLPIVGTDGPCTDSQLRAAHAFLLSQCGDAETFVKNVDLLFHDEPLRKLMRRAARDLFTRFFTWERIADEYWQLLRT